MVVVVIPMFAVGIARAGPSTGVVSWRCNGNSYESGDPFSYSLANVLNNMVTVTLNHPGSDYYTVSPRPVSIAYRHAACNPGLSSSICVTCIMSARDQMLNDCPTRAGAQVVLYDCKMRYERHPFTDN